MNISDFTYVQRRENVKTGKMCVYLYKIIKNERTFDHEIIPSIMLQMKSIKSSLFCFTYEIFY